MSRQCCLEWQDNTVCGAHTVLSSPGLQFAGAFAAAAIAYGDDGADAAGLFEELAARVLGGDGERVVAVGQVGRKQQVQLARHIGDDVVGVYRRHHA